MEYAPAAVDATESAIGTGARSRSARLGGGNIRILGSWVGGNGLREHGTEEETGCS
jgi:hypothetical protein